MTTQFLVRFDDICPTMNWAMWDRVEQLLQRQGVRPILAVVPDNRDPKLDVHSARENFWDRVREWQARGWAIGWHGYQHVYSSTASGIIGIHAGGEFAGHSESVQREKLAAAQVIFRRERVTPQVWIAPGHSFDMTTVRLLPEFGLRIISDGFYRRAVLREGCVWLPQQLWRFRQVGSGLWTVCCHFNSWNEAALDAFEASLQRHARAITCLDAVISNPAKPLNILDHLYAVAYGAAVRVYVHARKGASH